MRNVFLILTGLIIGVAGGSGAIGLFALIAQSSSLYMMNGLRRSVLTSQIRNGRFGFVKLLTAKFHHNSKLRPFDVGEFT